MSNRLTAETLKGIWAGITLPWNEDYSLDEPALLANLRRLCAAGVHGIYTTGSTGEFYALDLPELRHLAELVVAEVKPTGIPVMIGCCADDTRDVLRQIECAAAAGADGVQIALPYWMELTDAEVLGYFRDVARAFPQVPLMHYNIPRAKRFLVAADYRRVLEVAPNLIGVKFTFAGSHFGQLQDALQTLPELSFFVAENLLVTAMQLGARGSCSSVVCVNPDYMLRLYSLAEARRWDDALAMQARLCEFFRALDGRIEALRLGGIDPVVDKGMAVASGFSAGHQRTRPPYLGWSDEGVAAVGAWMRREFPELVPAGMTSDE